MEPLDPLSAIVGDALSTSAQFGRENFAGDPLVRDFVAWAKQQLGVDPAVFVTWACAPEVMVLDGDAQPILVRSERFDTLLVEYVVLRQFATVHSTNVVEGALRYAIQRWCSEFFLGFGNAFLGASALVASRAHRNDRLQVPAVRDESLASLSPLLRASVQCFCLGHELAHLPQRPGDAASLANLVDGLSLQAHIERDLEEAGVSEPARVALRTLAGEIDAENLLQEIDADLAALELVMVFLTDHFQVSLDVALGAAVTAFEAQCYLYALKDSCALLHRINEVTREADGMQRSDWLSGCKTSIRARCVLRRAGIILAKWSDPEGRVIVERVNSLVPVVDEMFQESGDFRELISQLSYETISRVECEARSIGRLERRSLFEQDLGEIRSDGDLRLDLFYMLIAMGYPGGTNGIAFLEYLFDRQEVAAGLRL